MHADTGIACGAFSYQKRMWCRAEQLCFSISNGVERLWIAEGKGAPPRPASADADWLNTSLLVFEGECTCCEREHRDGSGAVRTDCDRELLVRPILGLYGQRLLVRSRMQQEASRGWSPEGSSIRHTVSTMKIEDLQHQQKLSELPRHHRPSTGSSGSRFTGAGSELTCVDVTNPEDGDVTQLDGTLKTRMFPRTFYFKTEKDTEERQLFGDLIAAMEDFVKTMEHRDSPTSPRRSRQRPPAAAVRPLSQSRARVKPAPHGESPPASPIRGRSRTLPRPRGPVHGERGRRRSNPGI